MVHVLPLSLIDPELNTASSGIYTTLTVTFDVVILPSDGFSGRPRTLTSKEKTVSGTCSFSLMIPVLGSTLEERS